MKFNISQNRDEKKNWFIDWITFKKTSKICK